MAKDEIYVFYGSQTGQAETIAETIHEAAEDHDIKSTLMCLWKAEESFRIVSKGIVSAVFVCSTTGDGELPGTARRFMRKLAMKTHPDNHLSSLRYALLGLGDTNYSTFCGGPKTLERGLKKLGAESYYPTGYADDGTDLEIVVEPWIEGLWPALKAHLKARKTLKDTTGPLVLENTMEPPMTVSDTKSGMIENIIDGIYATSITDGTKNGTITNAASGIKYLEGDIKDINNMGDGVPSRGEAVLDAFKNALDKSDVARTLADTTKYQNSCESHLKVKSGISLSDIAEAQPDSKMDLSAWKGHLEVKFDTPLSDLSEKIDGTLPPLMQSYLLCEFSEQVPEDLSLSQIPCTPYPMAADKKYYSAEIKTIKKLTAENAIKTAFCVTLETSGGFDYNPGDAFGVFIQNPSEEVGWLIRRLKVESDCDETIVLKIDPTKKKNAKIPNYIPKFATVRYILQNCLEIRSVPKRTFLRALYEYTTSERDRNILRQLCRKESMDDFGKYIREPYLNSIDVLAAVPSCQPPFELLVEHLPRLKARLYSVANCPSTRPSEVRFVFNIVDFEPCDGRMYARKGLATGYLASWANNLPSTTADQQPSSRFPNLTIFKTKNNSFRLPEILQDPIIMVGPGTGVAPYIGFLEFLSTYKSMEGCRPETWLFYGCRNKKLDFLFEKELKSFVSDGTLTHLEVAFSRDTPTLDGARKAGKPPPKYVQDNLRLRWNDIVDLILHKNATFYVCGDAKNMARDVREAVVEILSYRMDKNTVSETLKMLVKNGKYKEDVWT